MLKHSAALRHFYTIYCR